MKTKFFLYLCLLFLFSSISPVNAQQLFQTIRGKIIDQDANYPIPAAHVVLLNTEPVIGTITDLDGNFQLDNVPVGRVNLAISSIGYESKVVPNILLTSAKEMVLNVDLQESIIQMEGIVITDKTQKGETLNDMATISARAFSVEETKRYAGAFNDPARMVSSFAGVMPAADGNNFIAVRGNSPKGIQWRLEGVEIPNPNHFSQEGATGGPINSLNSTMLANSDFFSGAFPAEYGNAFSGIYDMKLRNGNNQKREYSFSVGVIGTDMTAEGPFKKGSESSYLVNYRYSTLSLLDQLNLVDYSGVPKYQDLSFKINLPTRKMGRLSIFGLGGKSSILQSIYADENKDQTIAVYNSKSDMGVAGINYLLPLSKNTYLTNRISASENGSIFIGDEINNENNFYRTNNETMRKYSLREELSVSSKLSAKHFISSGVIYTHYLYDFFVEIYEKDQQKMIPQQNQSGNAGLVQFYGNWKYRINETLTLVGGAHTVNNRLNNSWSIEPRAGLKWQFSPTQTLNFGFGIHSQMESLPTYLVLRADSSTSDYLPNKNLGLAKSRHYVLGYENMLSPNLVFKLETYYQDLYNIPVENDPNSSFSLLNNPAWYSTKELVNQGTGYNYGLELTVERYFNKGYYFLLTTSLYESKYRAMDGILRDTRWNGNYVGNFLFGKEFTFSKKPSRSNTLGINSKISLIGARRFSPIDLEASREKGYTVTDDSEAFSLRGDNIFIPSISVTYRMNRKNTSHELKLDIQNFLNCAGMVDMYYDHNSDKIIKIYQMPMLPVVIYSLQF